MDRYAYMLGELRSDDFRRLRRYVADGTSEFSTWLVVVAQRMCLDHHRKRYGRPRGARDTRAREEEWAARRRLVDLLSARVDVSELSGPAGPGPDDDMRMSDLYGALDAALRCLDPSDRLLVKLRFEDDLSVSEIARTLRLPTRFHVYRHLAQVLTRLRGALEQKGVHDAIP
jgi:RNA polymerase sigma factor (sigma-70 family)